MPLPTALPHPRPCCHCHPPLHPPHHHPRPTTPPRCGHRCCTSQWACCAAAQRASVCCGGRMAAWAGGGGTGGWWGVCGCKQAMWGDGGWVGGGVGNWAAGGAWGVGYVCVCVCVWWCGGFYMPMCRVLYMHYTAPTCPPDALKQQLSLVHPLLETLRAPSPSQDTSSPAPSAAAASTLSFLYHLRALVQALDALQEAYTTSNDPSHVAANALTVKQCLLTIVHSGIPSDDNLASLLLFLVVPLLETQPGLLSFQETQSLLMAVHGGDATTPPAMKQSVQMALVRTLARAAAV